jgi:TRAP-type C4-dicarboxylate transport system permease small subunit
MKIERIAERVITLISNIIFAAMFLVVVLQIGGRYFMKNPFIWTEELARFLYVWLVFFGTSTLIKNYEHITIDILQRKLSVRGERIFKIIIDTLALVFFILVTLGGIKMMGNSGNARLPSNPAIRLSYLYLSLVVGSVFSGIFLVGNLVGNFKDVFLHSEVKK